LLKRIDRILESFQATYYLSQLLLPIQTIGRSSLHLKDLRAFKSNTSVERFGMSDMDVTRLRKSEHGWVKSPTKKRTKGSLQDIVCQHCGLTGHSRTSSQACLKHKSKPKPTDLQQVQEHPPMIPKMQQHRTWTERKA
jgi:hypothetical protein